MKKFLSYFVAALFCTSIQAQQLNESFEDEGFPPEDWEVNNSNTYGWKKGVKNGENCAMVSMSSYGGDNYLITPQLRPESGEKLHFNARIGENTSSGELRVEVSLSGTDLESFEVLETYYTSSKKGDAAHRISISDWSHFEIDLSAYKKQRIYIAFHATGEIGNGGLAIDEVSGVSMGGNADCENPYNIVMSELSANSVTFTWKGDADQFQYLLIEAGDDVNWAKGVKTSKKTVTLTDLYEETDYEFYVRSYCSASTQSLAPKNAFRTPCAAFNVPWLETFTRDETGSGFTSAAPDCWTIATPTDQISIVKDKTYDDEGNASTVQGEAHLQAYGGGPNSERIFAMPMFNAQLNKLEVAFDYKTSLGADYSGKLEVGYMTNPSKASTFVSLQTYEPTLTYKHVVCSLADLPASAKFIAFRFADGASDYTALAMDNFIVAEIGKSGEVDPSIEDIPDPSIWALSYCEAQFTWYSYDNSAFAIGLFDADAQALIAGITVTTGECDRFAYQDGIGFSEDDDYENHYYCSTKWILNVEEDAMQRGDSWSKCVRNIGTSTSPILGLNAGKYQVQVYALNQSESGYSRGELLATIPFELVEKKVTNLTAKVASDKKSATLTWDAPEFGQGERLYVRVWAGETVAYDNFDSRERPESPLTVDVVEGKTYAAIVQAVDKKNNPIGPEVACEFTVGTNKYEPKNPKAEVFGGDNVTFTWEAETMADFYDIVLYWESEYYTTLSVYSATKTTTMPKNGTWSWTVQPFTKGENDKYFPASNPVKGNDFTSKAADIPDDAIQLDVWAFEAAYLDKNSGYYQEGKNGWFLMFGTGEEGNQLPSVYLLVYTNKEGAVSGVYNVARGNIDLESCYIDVTGKQADAVLATDADIRLQFDGYDEEKAESGYRYGYYTGQFRLVGNDGKTYVAKFMELFCNSYNFSSMSTGILDHKGMWDEDPDYVPWDAVEDIRNHAGLDLNQPMYNIMGMQVGANYKGIVIQNGKKFMLW